MASECVKVTSQSLTQVRYAIQANKTTESCFEEMIDHLNISCRFIVFHFLLQNVWVNNNVQSLSNS